MIPNVTQFAYASAALLGTASIAVSHAELNDPDADPFKRLNLMMAQVIGWIALTLTGLTTLYFYGLIVPGIAAALLFAGYQLTKRRNLRAAYPFNYALAIAAIVCFVTAMIKITPA